MSRVLVALDLLRIQHRALEMGARLAVRENRLLTALFIESSELHCAAELPFVQEIDRLSATLQPFGPARLELLWQQRIQRVRSWLVELETSLSLAGSLEIQTGRYPETALALAVESDLLVLSTQVSASPIRRPPVWVWYDGSPACDRALALARQLAAQEDACLRVAAPAEISRALPEPVVVNFEGLLARLAHQECTAVVCPRTHPLAAQLPLRARCPVLLV